jgi:hypothetical protein
MLTPVTFLSTPPAHTHISRQKPHEYNEKFHVYDNFDVKCGIFTTRREE